MSVVLSLWSPVFDKGFGNNLFVVCGVICLCVMVCNLVCDCL